MKTKLEIIFNTTLKDFEELRELIEDNLGVEILEVNEILSHPKGWSIQESKGNI